MTSPSAQAGLSQAGLGALTARQVAELAAQLGTANLDRSLPPFIAALWRLIRRNGSVSAELAARFYLRQRAAAGARGVFRPPLVDPPPLEQVAASTRWAAQSLYWAAPDVDLFTAKLAGAAEKLTLDVGRASIINASHADPEAKGWARIPEPGACYFCALLATRGAVYAEDTAGFKSHDHCRCHAEPVFTAYEPSAEIRGWQSLYAQSTKGVHGMGNLQRAWRAAFEGRTAQQ